MNIEKQTEIAEAKIEELDMQIENLPELKKELITQYRLEKKESLKIPENRDYLKEKETENFKLFLHKESYRASSKENILKEEAEVFLGRKG